MILTYSEMIKFKTFEERFEYLKLSGEVGAETFGWRRWLNQVFYRTPEWMHTRREIIIRDKGCDLADPSRPIGGMIIVHHLNPITEQDIYDRTEFLLNPDYLVCVSDETHRAITYGNEDLLIKDFSPRTPNDTCPWKH